MSHPKSHDGSEFVPELSREHHMEDSLQANQGRLSNISFSVFNEDDPQLRRSRCENYFDMYGVESSSCGFVWRPCIWRELLLGGCNRMNDGLGKRIGMSFAL
jgi:hypothetical protein